MKKDTSLENYFETKYAKIIYIVLAAVVVELIIGFIIMEFGGWAGYGLGGTLILIGLAAFLGAFLWREAKVVKDDTYDEFFKKKISDSAFDNETKEYDHDSKVKIYFFEDYCPGEKGLIRKGKNGHARTDKYCKTKIITCRDKVIINYFECDIDGKTDFKYLEYQKGSVKFVPNKIEYKGFAFESMTVSEDGKDVITFPVPKNSYDVEELSQF